VEEWVKGYFEIEFDIPTGVTPDEFGKARKDALKSIENWLEELSKPTPYEQIFNVLKWETAESPKLGTFETAYKASNLPDNFSHAFNTLKANNATIKNHYAPEGFAHYYWLYLDKYDDRIFRKKRGA